MNGLVDWGVAERVAAAALGDEPAGRSPLDLGHLRDDAAARIARRTGLEPDELPPLEWVGRREWAAANVATLRATLDPSLAVAATVPTPVRRAAGAVAGAEAGALLGFLGRRVLGQLDLRLRGPDTGRRLLLVAPNLRAAATRLELDLVELTTWVAVHEVTHAVQFGGAPWLREHLGAGLEELLAAAVRPPSLRGLLGGGPQEVLALVGRLRSTGLSGLLLGPRERETLDRMQATMALIEGHAEWTMDAVGADVVPDVGALRRALEARRDDRSPVVLLLDRLLGMELKLRQYRDGRAWCDAIVRAGGEPRLADVWAGPEALPRPAELRDPHAWLARA